MPAQRCQKDGKPGWKWGSEGFCYTYTSGDKEGSARAKRKANVQGAAIKVSQTRNRR